ncbi:muts domain V-domain-containing protein [Thamnidium elegans]|nr:muts domain V-domain-containing protein [Thamnidium elegans]
MTTTETEDIPEIGNSEQQTFVQFYNSLDINEQGTIRLFEREANGGTYYTLHGDNATYAADKVYQTTTVIKYWFGDITTGLATTKLTDKVAKNFLRDSLLNKQLRIEIWKQFKQEWRVISQASPGNLQQVEEFLFSSTRMDSAPVVIAVNYGISMDQKTVGVSFADTTINQLGVSQFIDNESFSNLETLIIQLGVKECILPSSNAAEKDFDRKKINDILSRCNVALTETKKNLNRLLEGDINVEALPEYEMKSALSSCACIISYLKLMGNDENFGKFTLNNHDLSQYMRLDGPALAALNLLPTVHDGPNKNSSLFGLLNKCRTAQGSRLFAQWLKQPLLSLNEITKRQDIVQAFVEDTDLRQNMQEAHLHHVPDLHRISKKVLKGNASLQDVVRIYQVILRLPALIGCLRNCVSSNPEIVDLVRTTYTTKLEEHYSHLTKLEELVVTTIDLDAADNHEYIIKAEYNEELQIIYTEMKGVERQMALEFERVAGQLGLEKEKKLRLEKHSLYGHCFRIIGRTEASKIRNKSEYIELNTQKSGTIFTTRRLKDCSTRYEELSRSYEDKQRGLVKEVISIVGTYCPTLESLGFVIAHMDVLISFAHVSVLAPTPYVRPTMSPCGQGNVILENARHPCLEVQDYVTFIPNDVDMIRETSEFKIVTGPNMGGKSTYIRQVGVIALMAQIGCFVPCTKASLCIFDSILARVGASDSQLKGVSTFMAEMLETATILKTATRNSLVIIDELGRGTSTSDGIGLAWSISEHLAKHTRSFCLFATHFHELTTLTEMVPYVENLHVAVHVGSGGDVTLLYKVNKGVGDKSFGIHVAGLANFPTQVIRLAKRKAIELDQEADLVRGIEVNPKQEVIDGELIMAQMVQELAKQVDQESVKQKYLPQIEANAYLKEILLDDTQ